MILWSSRNALHKTMNGFPQREQLTLYLEKILLRRHLIILSIPDLTFIVQWKDFLQLLIWALLISALCLPWFLFLLFFLLRPPVFFQKKTDKIQPHLPLLFMPFTCFPPNCISYLIIEAETIHWFISFNPGFTQLHQPVFQAASHPTASFSS